jgi:hypothetical protein
VNAWGQWSRPLVSVIAFWEIAPDLGSPTKLPDRDDQGPMQLATLSQIGDERGQPLIERRAQPVFQLGKVLDMRVPVRRDLVIFVVVVPVDCRERHADLGQSASQQQALSEPAAAIAVPQRFTLSPQLKGFGQGTMPNDPKRSCVLFGQPIQRGPLSVSRHGPCFQLSGQFAAHGQSAVGGVTGEHEPRHIELVASGGRLEPGTG